eukprot:s22_g60.t1
MTVLVHGDESVARQNALRKSAEGVRQGHIPVGRNVCNQAQEERPCVRRHVFDAAEAGTKEQRIDMKDMLGNEPRFVAQREPTTTSLRPSSLRGTQLRGPVLSASGGHAGVSAAAFAGLLACGVPLLHGRRSAPASRPARKPRVQRLAEDDGLWQPRLTGWTPQDLAAERQRAMSMPDTPGYSGPRYTGAASITDAFIDGLISAQEQGQLLPKKDAYLIVLDIIDLLREEKTMGQVSIPEGGHLTIVGDLHGQYWDFMNVLSLSGKPSPSTPFIFNGDFVDRGSWSIEVIMTIFALKLKDPGAVFLNRGNHEMLETNILYGFCGECGAKYDMELFNLFSEAFRNLPLVHLVDNKVLVLHGGLPGPDPRIWMPGQTFGPRDGGGKMS